MYQGRRDQRREPRRTQWTTNVVLSFRGQMGEIFFHPVDESAQSTFFQNLRKLDEGAFRVVASQAATGSFNGGSPVAILGVEDLQSALKAGETLFTGFEPDGGSRNCGICGSGFQPVRIPFTHKDGNPGLGGNFATLKTEKLAELIGKGGDLAARVQGSSDAMTAEVMGDEKVPSRAKAMPVCKDCRDLLGVQTFALETLKAGLLGADQRIGVTADRYAAAAILGRPQRRAVGAGPSDGRRYNDRQDFRGNGRDDRRPEKPRVDWYGASLEEATAQAMTAAGYANLSDALTAAENGELMSKGIAHAGSIGPITFALKRASDGRQIVGQAHGAVSAPRQQAVSTPGASRPAAPRGKKREFTAPNRSGGKGVGLAELGE